MLYGHSMKHARTYQYLLTLLLTAGCSFAEADQIAREQSR